MAAERSDGSGRVAVFASLMPAAFMATIVASAMPRIVGQPGGFAQRLL